MRGNDRVGVGHGSRSPSRYRMERGGTDSNSLGDVSLRITVDGGHQAAPERYAASAVGNRAQGRIAASTT